MFYFNILMNSSSRFLYNEVSKTKKIHTCHELFLGGGSVLLAILTLQKHKHISLKHVVASDIIEGLINMYLRIQNNARELYTLLSSYYKTHITQSKEQ